MWPLLLQLVAGYRHHRRAAVAALIVVAWPISFAAAMVLTDADGAKRAPRPPAWVIAHAKRTEFSQFPGRDTVKPVAGVDCAKALYQKAGIRDPRRQIDVAELYVPFSWYEPMWLEGHLICDEGQGWKMTDAGETERPVEGGPAGGTVATRHRDVRSGEECGNVMYGPDGADYPEERMFTERALPEQVALAGAARPDAGCARGVANCGPAGSRFPAAGAPTRDRSGVSRGSDIWVRRRAAVLRFGPAALSVRVEDGTHGGDALLPRLGDLFQPRVGRHSRYRASSLAAGPATIERLYSTLAEALSRPRSSARLRVDYPALVDLVLS